MSERFKKVDLKNINEETYDWIIYDFLKTNLINLEAECENARIRRDIKREISYRFFEALMNRRREELYETY